MKNLEEEFQNLKPALSDLARQASQYVEHGDLDAATRIELRLRLAEFESALKAAHPWLPPF
jgi:hypothetical protein